MKTVLVCVRTPESARRIAVCATRMGRAQRMRAVVSVEEIHARMSAGPVDVVLIDAAMARPDLVNFTRAVHARSPHTGVIFVGAVDPRVATMAVAAGARGVVRDGETDADLIVAVAQAIMLMWPGETTPSLPGSQSARPQSVPRQRTPAGVLTQRETQVLRGMSEGKSNAEIGRELFVSEDTVKTHARRLFRKLRARDRAHAVAEAFRTGIVN